MVSCRAYTSNHSSCEFMYAITVSYPEDSIFQHPSLSSGSYIPPDLSSGRLSKPSSGGERLTLTINSLISYESLHQPLTTAKKNVSDPDLEQHKCTDINQYSEGIRNF